MNTSTILKRMMKENTGTHCMDSGGKNNRHWKQNGGRDFDKEPVGTIEVYGNYIEAKLSTYHFLCNMLEYNADLQHEFAAFCRRVDNRNDCWLVNMENFASFLGGRGPYGEGPPLIVNTYNHESALDQVILYVFFTDRDGQAIVILQVHGGCDVRGGYTKPKCFYASESILSDSSLQVFCDNDQEHWWASENGGSSLVYQNEYRGTRLDSYDITDTEENCGKGMIYHDNTNVYCPLCGGKLAVGL